MNYEEKQRQKYTTTSIIQGQKVNFKGLTNNGATCYLNTLLQSIFHTEVGYNFILNIQNDIKALEEVNRCEYISSDNNSVIQSLQLLFLRMKFSTQSELSTLKFCRSMNINTAIQEDANELMKTIQDKLEQVCKQQNMLGIYNQTFTGQSSIKYTCKHCGSESPVHTPFTDVMLPVAPDFFTCFAQMVSQYQISEYKCTQCNQLTYADQELSIYSVPDLLCFTLERFKNVMKYQKDCSQVNFPMCLDLEFIYICNCDQLGNDKEHMQRLIQVAMMPWLHFQFQGQNIQAKDAYALQFTQSVEFMQHLRKYYLGVKLSNDQFKTPIFNLQAPPNFFTLKSVVRHSGQLTGGHYQSLIVQQALICNDSSVSEHKITEEDLSAPENYMYFFERAKYYEPIDYKFQRIKEIIKEDDEELTRGRRLNEDQFYDQTALNQKQIYTEQSNNQLNSQASPLTNVNQDHQTDYKSKQIEKLAEQLRKEIDINKNLLQENFELKQELKINKQAKISTNYSIPELSPLKQQQITDLNIIIQNLQNDLKQAKQNQRPNDQNQFFQQINEQKFQYEQQINKIQENAQQNLFNIKHTLQYEHEREKQKLQTIITEQNAQMEILKQQLKVTKRQVEPINADKLMKQPEKSEESVEIVISSIESSEV
ncbi:Ubiquitin_carboxyl-terminal hydrolase family protein [Hexamita inflata]|uniref:Ubiquitin_carboxyl-terminal hydrolase family protein n=1 Tax=Hexamita inflata TaxID=28002 RepID=A0ABP1JXB2_9EUKA